LDAEIILFEHAHFGGRRKSIFGDVLNLNAPGDNDFNDITSSIIVVSGTWQCFPDWHYEGRPSKQLVGYEQEPTLGYYSYVENSNVDIRNDSISSVKLIHG